MHTQLHMHSPPSPTPYRLMFAVLQDVISFGCGGDMMSEYKSMVYYHEDKPKWFETFKVSSS